jgi:AhpD family alkylhydroperoxidase
MSGFMEDLDSSAVTGKMIILDITTGGLTMARIELSAEQRADIREVWSGVPGIGEAWLSLSDVIYTKSSLPARLRECARMRIAQINQCQMCLGVRFDSLTAEGIDAAMYDHVAEYATWPGYSDPERLAIELAERFCLDHLSMDAAFWQRMHAAFTDEEILELGLSVATWVGQGRLTQVLGLDVSCGLGHAGDDGKFDQAAVR